MPDAEPLQSARNRSYGQWRTMQTPYVRRTVAATGQALAALTGGEEPEGMTLYCI